MASIREPRQLVGTLQDERIFPRFVDLWRHVVSWLLAYMMFVLARRVYCFISHLCASYGLLWRIARPSVEQIPVRQLARNIGCATPGDFLNQCRIAKLHVIDSTYFTLIVLGSARAFSIVQILSRPLGNA